MHFLIKLVIKFVLEHLETLIDLLFEGIHAKSHLLLSSVVISREDIADEAVDLSSARV